jgi:hypothetical protein
MLNKKRLALVIFSVAAMGLPSGALVGLSGCSHHEPQYGVEAQVSLPGKKRQTWAIAPAVNLSGISDVDPLLQADLVYGQVQQIGGITVIPVNRVAEVYASLHIDRVESEDQAGVVCDLLGCDGLIVPTVTLYDPYNPPKFGAALQLFQRSAAARVAAANIDPRELARRGAPSPTDTLLPTAATKFVQAVGIFDAANGSTREALWHYAEGRNDPIGPLGTKEYLVSMDRYCGFAYFKLSRELVDKLPGSAASGKK